MSCSGKGENTSVALRASLEIVKERSKSMR
jgi:hypothetical protein